MFALSAFSNNNPKLAAITQEKKDRIANENETKWKQELHEQMIVFRCNLIVSWKPFVATNQHYVRKTRSLGSNEKYDKLVCVIN